MSRNSWWGLFFSEEAEKNNEKSTTETTPDKLVVHHNQVNTKPEDLPPVTSAHHVSSRDGIPIPITKAASEASESPSSVASTLVDQDLSASPAIPIPKQRTSNSRAFDDTKRNPGSIRNWLSYNTTSTNSNNNSNHTKTASSNSLPNLDEKISEPDVSVEKINNTNATSSHHNNNSNSNSSNSNNQIQQIRQGELPGPTLSPLVESAQDNFQKTQNDHDITEIQKVSESKLSSSHASSSSRSSWLWKFGSINASSVSTTKDGNETTTIESQVEEPKLEPSTKEPIIDSELERLPSKHHQKRPSSSSKSIEGQGQSNLTEAPKSIASSSPSSSSSAAAANTAAPTCPPEFISLDNNSTPLNVTDGTQTNTATGLANTKTIKRRKSSEMKRWSFLGNWSVSSPNLLATTNEEGENPNETKGNAEASSLSDHSRGKTPTASVSAPPSPTLTFSPSTNNHNVPPQNEVNTQTTSHHHNKQPLNPLVATLPSNRASWMYFFSHAPAQQPVAEVGSSTPRKLITSGAEQHSIVAYELNKQKTNGKDIPVTEKLSTPPSPKLRVKAVPSNKVLPPFAQLPRFRISRRPNSIIEQTLHAINSYFFPPEKPPESGLPKLLDELTRSTHDVKRIAIIGVHGWFPAKLMRAVVGEPTGTSEKFCDMMEKAIVAYLAQHGVNLPNDAITLMPLHGEGKIEDRVNILFKNLMIRPDWVSALSSADAVFIATHSQGTPVSTILLARLIRLGYLNPKRQRTCMLAMAGINHGPFPYLKSTWVVRYLEADAARELFEFMDHNSEVAKKYYAALNTVTQAGVKLVYVASMDDQVVPLYSSTFTGLTHPAILRAVYIDGPMYRENDFLTNLIVFAIRLRNSGIRDHNLMVHLSDIIAGSLTGEGHSALYEEIDVYTLSVRYLFEAASPSNHNMHLETFSAQKSYNPYFLPWAMRGIMDDQKVIRSQYLLGELEKLRKQYDEWEPVSKAMKDIKFRLEPLRESISKAKL